MITSISYLLVTVTVLVMGVLSTQDRRLTSSGTISFVPDLRAAVDISFTMTGAWQNGVELTDQSGTFKNYQAVLGSNPKVNQDGKFENVTGNILDNGEIKYDSLEFNPGADNDDTPVEIVITFTITNRSAISEGSTNPLKVGFNEVAGNEIFKENSDIMYTLSDGVNALTNDEISINKDESGTLVIKLQLHNLRTVTLKNFNFELTFGF